jgi:hypothetical protein
MNGENEKLTFVPTISAVCEVKIEHSRFKAEIHMKNLPSHIDLFEPMNLS